MALIVYSKNAKAQSYKTRGHNVHVTLECYYGEYLVNRLRSEDYAAYPALSPLARTAPPMLPQRATDATHPLTTRTAPPMLPHRAADVANTLDALTAPPRR